MDALFQDQRLTWFGAIAVLLGLHGVSLYFGVESFSAPILTAASLLFIFYRGDAGQFPFRKRHVVEYQMSYFAFVIALAAVFNTASANSVEAMPKYYWAIPMIAIYAVGLYLRRSESRS